MAVFVFLTGFDLVLLFLGAGAFLSFGDLTEALDTARDLALAAPLPLAGRLVVARLAATFFPVGLEPVDLEPVDLEPVDLATTAFLPVDARARPTGALFLVVVFLGLKGYHPVNIRGA